MQQNLMQLDGRIVIVAGAAGGSLGTMITRMAATAGATVIGVSRGQANLELHLGPMIAEGLQVIPVVADVETAEGVAKVMDVAGRTAGDLYGLVTVVGGGPPASWGPATKLSRAMWDSLFSTNLESMFFITQAVAAKLKEQGRPGSIVAISSITGVGNMPYNVGYGAAKAAILSVVRTMALELASSNIRVNTVAPGAMSSPSSMLPPNPEIEGRAIPMGRKGEMQEVAGTVLFLLSDLAGYMTGQCLVVDGGVNLRWSHLAPDNTPLLVTNEEFLKVMRGD